MRKQCSLILLLTFIFITAYSQAETDEAVEMADLLRRDGKIFTVVIGLVLILTIMIVLLIRVDRRIFRLEKDINSRRKM